MHGIFGCPGPYDLLRQEPVMNKAAFICPDFWIEVIVLDRRIKCPECDRVHMVIVSQQVRHEGNFYDQHEE
jgi:hypothetical protein